MALLAKVEAALLICSISLGIKGPKSIMWLQRRDLKESVERRLNSATFANNQVISLRIANTELIDLI